MHVSPFRPVVMMLNSTAVCQTHVHTFPATLGAESRARGRQGQDRRGLPVLDALTAVMHGPLALPQV